MVEFAFDETLANVNEPRIRNDAKFLNFRCQKYAGGCHQQWINAAKWVSHIESLEVHGGRCNDLLPQFQLFANHLNQIGKEYIQFLVFFGRQKLHVVAAVAYEVVFRQQPLLEMWTLPKTSGHFDGDHLDPDILDKINRPLVNRREFLIIYWFGEWIITLMKIIWFCLHTANARVTQVTQARQMSIAVSAVGIIDLVCCDCEWHTSAMKIGWSLETFFMKGNSKGLVNSPMALRSIQMNGTGSLYCSRMRHDCLPTMFYLLYQMNGKHVWSY